MLNVCRDCLTLFAGSSGPCPRCASARLAGHSELADLCIAHIDCDAFYASVEKRDRPELANQPLLIGSTSGRGVVTTACYLARKFGPRSAMPMFKALQLCPDAAVIRPDMEKYKTVSRQIQAIFHDETPVIEPLSLDEAYLDLGQENRTAAHDPPAVCLARIAQRVETQVGITVSVGLSHNKFLAKLASDIDKPRGFTAIGRAEAREFLSQLPVGRIHGVGAATERRMAQMGLETIGQLQTMDPRALVGRFGRFGHRLTAYVNGDDPRRVTPSRATKSVSSETTFSQDLRDRAPLEDRLAELCEKVALRLSAKELAGRTVVLKLKTRNFQSLTRNHSLPWPTARADVLFRVGTGMLVRELDGRWFRLIGIGVSDLSNGAYADPPDLFEAADLPT